MNGSLIQIKVTLIFGEHKMEKFVIEHLENASGYRAILKNIPYTDENLRDIKILIRKFYKNQKIVIRPRWRGIRYHHPYHNIKSEAITFDIYIYFLMEN